MAEIVLRSRSCLLRSHLIQLVAACWVLREIRQDPTSYPPGRGPGQDQKPLISVRGDLPDLAVQRKPWLTAALTALGNSFSLPLGTEWYREMTLKGHSCTCAAACVKFTPVPLLFLWWKHKQTSDPLTLSAVGSTPPTYPTAPSQDHKQNSYHSWFSVDAVTVLDKPIMPGLQRLRRRCIFMCLKGPCHQEWQIPRPCF